MPTDRPLNIAVAPNRKTKTWKNTAQTWKQICSRLEQVTRTPETVAEYKAMPRERQADIKDVGGFVGGYCPDGNRSAVQTRSLLCLDADYAQDGLWADWLLQYGNAGAVYSTHKHTPGKPRLRLVVPLARDVSPDEYQAIGRRVAQVLGMDQFDDTSYQPQRLMYWPSASRDGEYVFQCSAGDLLDPDAVLATYADWRDASTWPTSSRVATAIKKATAKQQDPTQKPGLIGAFCRAYSIDDAIAEFIPDYQPAGADRYTYTGGSTSGGVVVYEGKFSYSHHATDPASLQQCNAWDLVRLHRFGDMDADVDPDTPTRSRPSYAAMRDWARTIDRVRVQIVEDRTTEAAADFAAAPVPEEPDGDWRARLKITEKGGLASCIENVVTILRHDDALRDRVGYNEMSHNIVVTDALPWRASNGETQWTDADDADLRYYLERRYGLTGKDKIFDGLNVVAMSRRFHPVRDYLDAAMWDGVPRVDSLLVDYLGAENSAYTHAVTRKTLAAAVARIYRPGCKFDYMLTLRGRQGLGKSALIAKLGGPWFSDSFMTMQGKDAYEQVLGVWLVEVGELAGMRKAEAETIKLYISKQTDRFRPAYGRRIQEFPRQCIFIATTNESQFLRDSTGNRRFWVVDTPRTAPRDMWDELTPETVQQIWAEAVEIYRAGEPLYLPPELEAAARETQERYAETNPWEDIISAYLERDLPADWETRDLYSRRAWLESGETGTEPRRTVSNAEIWSEALGRNPAAIDRAGIKAIREVMDRLPDWVHQGNLKTLTRPYGRQRYFARKE